MREAPDGEYKDALFGDAEQPGCLEAICLRVRALRPLVVSPECCSWTQEWPIDVLDPRPQRSSSSRPRLQSLIFASTSPAHPSLLQPATTSESPSRLPLPPSPSTSASVSGTLKLQSVVSRLPLPIPPPRWPLGSTSPLRAPSPHTDCSQAILRSRRSMTDNTACYSSRTPYVQSSYTTQTLTRPPPAWRSQLVTCAIQ